MYLVSIEIENLRAIRQLSLDFMSRDGSRSARRWTVLLGENGCGKSTVLKAIGLALAGSEALPELLGNPNDWVRNGAKQAAVGLTVRTADDVERVINLKIVRGDRVDAVIKRNHDGLAQLDAALEKSNLNYFVAGYGAFRRPPDSDQERGWSRRHRQRATSLNTLFNGDAGLIGMDQWARQLDYRSDGQGREIIAAAISKLLPGMSFAGIDKETGQLLLDTQDGAIQLRHLSEGYQAMAAWAGDLLSRMTESFTNHKNPLNARGVLLIDEMDLHLHPVWKRRLVEFINDAFPKLQIVATTHSPLSIQQCGEGELYVVRRDGRRGPELVPFKGDPSRMRLSELFLSPLIGLETLDSPRVAELRDVARSIELRPGNPSQGESTVLRRIAQQLEGTISIADEEIPGFEAYTEQVRELRKVDPLRRMVASNALFGIEPSSQKIKSKLSATKALGKARTATGASRSRSQVLLQEGKALTKKVQKPVAKVGKKTAKKTTLSKAKAPVKIATSVVKRKISTKRVAKKSKKSQA